MKTKILMSTILVLTLTLAACAPKATTTPKQGPAPAAKPPVSKPTIAPTKTIKAPPTTKPTATPIPKPTSTPTVSSTNQIVVYDQSVKSNSVLVNMVNAVKPGWVVISTDQNGQLGIVLGYAAVPAGVSKDIKVNINSSKATDTLIASLHIDAGKIGTFEYPGPDVPVMNDKLVVLTVFHNK